MLQRVIKFMANENKYYPTFLVGLAIYALIMMFVIGFCVSHCPAALPYVIIGSMILSGIYAVSIRLIHVWCHNFINKENI